MLDLPRFFSSVGRMWANVAAMTAQSGGKQTVCTARGRAVFVTKHSSTPPRRAIRDLQLATRNPQMTSGLGGERMRIIRLLNSHTKSSYLTRLANGGGCPWQWSCTPSASPCLSLLSHQQPSRKRLHTRTRGPEPVQVLVQNEFMKLRERIQHQIEKNVGVGIEGHAQMGEYIGIE